MKGDRWFRQWKHWAYGEAMGFYIYKKGQHIKIYNSDRRLVDSAVIQTQKD